MTDFFSNRIDNIFLYNEIIPEFYRNLTDFDENKFIDEDFNKQIYKIICSLKAKYLNNIISNYSPNMAFNNDDNFMTFTMTFDKQFDYLTSYNYDENEIIPFFITINKSNLICQFVEPLTMIQKLSKSDLRYLSYEVDFSDFMLKRSRSAHSVLLVFDQSTREMYILDSNGTLDYFDSYLGCLDETSNQTHQINTSNQTHPKIKNALLESFRKYADMIGYKFKTNDELDLDLSINYRIKSTSQKDFFQGYCRAWSLYFQAILSNAPYNFDAIRYLQQFSQYDLKLLNEIIEMFQVYIYNKYLKDTIAIEDLPNLNNLDEQLIPSETEPTETEPTETEQTETTETEQSVFTNQKVQLEQNEIIEELSEEEILEQIILMSF